MVTSPLEFYRLATTTYFLKDPILKAREMALQLRAPAAVAEDLSWTPSTHMAANNPL